MDIGLTYNGIFLNVNIEFHGLIIKLYIVYIRYSKDKTALNVLIFDELFNF